MIQWKTASEVNFRESAWTPFSRWFRWKKTSCTLKVTTEEDMGWLFVLKGNLIAAETAAISGAEAACIIISWEDSVIEIDNACDKKDDEIKQPLMNILMEGLRLRDENRAKSGGKPPRQSKRPGPADSAPASKETTDASTPPGKHQPSTADTKPVKKTRPTPAPFEPAAPPETIPGQPHGNCLSGGHHRWRRVSGVFPFSAISQPRSLIKRYSPR